MDRMRTHRATPQHLQARYFSPHAYLLSHFYRKSVTHLLLDVCQAENLRLLPIRYCYSGIKLRCFTAIIFRYRYGYRSAAWATAIVGDVMG